MSYAKQAAQEIRAALKARGIKARAVSVRSDHGSLSITIKSADVPKALVEHIAGAYERISRCSVSGEILSGGNTFVSVSYDRDLLADMAAPYLAEISEDRKDTRHVRGWEVYRTDEGGHYFLATKRGRKQIHCWGREFCAEQMAIADAVPTIHVKADCVQVG